MDIATDFDLGFGPLKGNEATGFVATYAQLIYKSWAGYPIVPLGLGFQQQGHRDFPKQR